MYPTTTVNSPRVEADYLRPRRSARPVPALPRGLTPRRATSSPPTRPRPSGCARATWCAPSAPTRRARRRRADGGDHVRSAGTWLLWGSKATVISPSHAATVRVLERSTDRGRDGFVELSGRAVTAAQIDAALAADPTSPRSATGRTRATAALAARLRHRGDAALPWGPQWCGADALDLAAGEVVS